MIQDFVGLNGSILKVLCGSLRIDLHLGWLEYISIQSLIPRKAMHNWPLLMKSLFSLGRWVVRMEHFHSGYWDFWEISRSSYLCHSQCSQRTELPSPNILNQECFPEIGKTCTQKAYHAYWIVRTIVLHLQNHLKQKLITHTHFKHLRSLWSNNFAVWRFCFGRQVTQKQLNWTKSNVTTVAVATKAPGRR